MSTGDVYTLGIICFGWHDAAAVLVKNGEIVAAAEEERFTRKKFDAGFPRHAIQFCLDHAGIKMKQINAVGYGFDARAKLGHRAFYLLKTLPKSLSLLRSRQESIKNVAFFSRFFRREYKYGGPIFHFNHHVCHAASSYLTSPFDSSAIITIDGAGDWEATWWGVGEGEKINHVGHINWPYSLGHVYAAFTEYLGFSRFSDEYKVMGLAAYGEPRYGAQIAKIFGPSQTGYFIDLKYFNFPMGRYPYYSSKLVELFGPARHDDNDEDMPQKYRDIAASLQLQLEQTLFHLCRKIRLETKQKNLCLAGGVTLNGVANGKLIIQNMFDQIHVPPCASDAGTALGAAFLAFQRINGGSIRRPLSTACLGPIYSGAQIEQALLGSSLNYRKVEDPSREAAELLASGQVIGWFQDRLEFGQRALGSRSILADPRRAEMKDLINLKVKYREAFRPFAPSVVNSVAPEYFVGIKQSPFMTAVFPVDPAVRHQIPAVTHVDGTARVQTVCSEAQPLYSKLIHEFASLTGVPVLLNTSFNLKGEPIVNTPDDAIHTFKRSNLDKLVIGHYVVERASGEAN